MRIAFRPVVQRLAGWSRWLVTALTSLRWRDVQPWAGTVARVVLGALFVYAGALKVGDLAASGRAVTAFRLLPPDLSRVVGAVQPFVEIALGLLLIVGLATRIAGALIGAMLVVFIGGIASVWARGLQIDCGCFSEGGNLSAGQQTAYLWDIVRDLMMLAPAVFVVVYPQTRLSVDARLARFSEFEEDDEEDEPAESDELELAGPQKS